MSRSLASSYDLIILDLDGVVYLDEDPIEGAADAIRYAVETGTKIVYLTNNASRRAHEVAALLNRNGIAARPDEVLTSGQATAQVLAEKLPAGAPVLEVGSTAIGEELAAVGLSPVDSADARPVAVVQGYGPQVGWPQLAEVCVAVRAGATWVATNTDTTVPSPRGALPGNGSLVAAVSTALGGRAPDLVVGKPQPTLFELAMRSYGARRALAIGDRLDTDVAGANRSGVDSLLVLTGVATGADLLRAASSQRPTYVAANLGALAQPAVASRVPQWQGEARAGRWQVRRVDDRLILSAEGGGGVGGGVEVGDTVDAVRALAAAAWAAPGWSGVRSDSRPAQDALAVLGLAEPQLGPPGIEPPAQTFHRGEGVPAGEANAGPVA